MKSEMMSCVGQALCLSLISLGLLCSEETLQTLPSWTFCSACIVVANVAVVWCSLVQSRGCTDEKHESIINTLVEKKSFSNQVQEVVRAQVNSLRRH